MGDQKYKQVVSYLDSVPDPLSILAKVPGDEKLIEILVQEGPIELLNKKSGEKQLHDYMKFLKFIYASKSQPRAVKDKESKTNGK